MFIVYRRVIAKPGLPNRPIGRNQTEDIARLARTPT